MSAMPTDDERRKVAAEMREYPAELTATLHPAEEALACYVLDLMSIVGLEDGQVMGFFARLADLIEPEPERTCELELTWSGHTRALVRTYECARCGKSCDRVYGEDYKFCPYCGRRSEHADE